MPTHIGLPDEHAERIKRFAESRNMSMADAVGELIKIAVEAGKIPAGLPGYDVARSGSTITISAEGGYTRTMPLDLAKAFAVALRWFAKPKGGMQGALALADAAQSLAGVEHVGIKRRGNSIKIFDEKGAERTLAPSVARDLADQVERILN